MSNSLHKLVIYTFKPTSLWLYSTGLRLALDWEKHCVDGEERVCEPNKKISRKEHFANWPWVVDPTQGRGLPGA